MTLDCNIIQNATIAGSLPNYTPHLFCQPPFRKRHWSDQLVVLDKAVQPNESCQKLPIPSMGRCRSGSADNTHPMSSPVVPDTVEPTATEVTFNHHVHSASIDWSKHTQGVDHLTTNNTCYPSTGRFSTSITFQEDCHTPNSALLNYPKLNYPFNGTTEPCPQESIQDDENLFWDINLTDPLMTDAIYETEDLIFTHSNLLKQLDANQCNLCSTPYLMQYTGFLSDNSPTTSADAVWPVDSQSTSPTHSSSSEMSDPSFGSLDSFRKRKPKFFRSSRFSHAPGCELDHRQHASVRGVRFTKRWTPRCSPAYLRTGKRSKTNSNPIPCASRTASTSSNDSAPRLPFFPDRTPGSTEHAMCGMHNLSTVDEGYTSDMTSVPTIDPSPYAFDATSPTLKQNGFQPSFRSEPHFRGTGAHGPKRLHLLQFILKLLREPKDKRTSNEQSWQSSALEHEQGESISECCSSSACVEWVNESERIFTIKNPFRLAQLWGMYKNNWNMTFDSVCRSLRLYYVSGKLERIRGQRNQYRLLGPHR